MPTGDQSEHAITERQPPPVIAAVAGVVRRAFILDDRDSQRAQPGRGDRDIGRPRLGGHRQPRPRGKPGQAFTTAGSHVQHGASGCGAAGNLAAVAPWQRRRRRPCRQPRGIPARKRGVHRLADKLLKRRHPASLAQTQPDQQRSCRGHSHRREPSATPHTTRGCRAWRCSQPAEGSLAGVNGSSALWAGSIAVSKNC